MFTKALRSFEKFGTKIAGELTWLVVSFVVILLRTATAGIRHTIAILEEKHIFVDCLL